MAEDGKENEDVTRLEILLEKLKPICDVLRRIQAWDYQAWKQARNTSIEKVGKAADVLDSVSHHAGVAHVVGGAGQVLGGLAIAFGVLTLNPVAVAGGTAAVIAGGVTSFVADLAQYGWEHAESDEAQHAMERDRALTEEFQRLSEELGDELKKLKDDPEALEIFKDVAKGTWKSYTIYTTFRRMQYALEAIGFVALNPGYEFLAEYYGRVIFQEVAIDLTWMRTGWRWVIFEAGETGARVLTEMFVVFDFVFGIWDIYRGTKEITHENEYSSKMRELVLKLRSNEAQIESVWASWQVERWGKRSEDIQPDPAVAEKFVGTWVILRPIYAAHYGRKIRIERNGNTQGLLLFPSSPSNDWFISGCGIGHDKYAQITLYWPNHGVFPYNPRFHAAGTYGGQIYKDRLIFGDSSSQWERE